MVPLFVGSTSGFSGKNVVCLGMAKRFINDGIKMGYFKPVGVFPVQHEGALTDEDVVFFKDALNLTDALIDLCPVVLTEGLLTRVLKGKAVGLCEKMLDAFKKVAEGKDMVLVNGLGNLHHGEFMGCAGLNFINATGAKVILTDRFEYLNLSIDGFLQAKELLGDKLVGVIVNRIDPGKMDKVRELAVPFLKEHGISVLGMMSEDPVLGAVTVGDLRETLGGDLVCGEDNLDSLVERFCIGAMNVESALRVFRRVTNKAVVTGGDRSDIQLAALETSTRCLVLTGDLYPSQQIIIRAEECGVPIIVVPLDTQTTVEKFESILGALSIRNESKVARAAELVEQTVDFDTIYSALGLK
jgi:BioD-like phosphotransacetylase family protein